MDALVDKHAAMGDAGVEGRKAKEVQAPLQNDANEMLACAVVVPARAGKMEGRRGARDILTHMTVIREVLYHGKSKFSQDDHRVRNKRQRGRGSRVSLRETRRF